jgi:type IV pilus assembly protein PilC
MSEKKLSPFEEKLNKWVSQYFSRIPFIQKVFFVEHLHIMIHAGLSLVESLEVLSKEISHKKLKDIVGEIKSDIEKGQPLSEALAKHPNAFPPIYTKMIEAGEIAGKLEESLRQIGIQMQKSYQLTSSIKSAMIYPAVIVVAMGGIGIMMVTVVLPKLMEMFKEFNAELPLATRILIKVSDFMSQPLNLILLVLIIFGVIFAFVKSLKKFPKFRFFIHNLNLHLPIAGKIIKKINLARFSLTLSSLLKSTIPIAEAIDITADTCGNLLYRRALHDASQKIKTGQQLSEILSVSYKLFPPIVTEMVMVGEKSGEVDQLLDELANFYGNEVDKTMKNFSTIIEPVIILLLGLAVAGIAVAVITPMYSLIQDF